jgi:hypothetical protein
MTRLAANKQIDVSDTGAYDGTNAQVWAITQVGSVLPL